LRRNTGNSTVDPGLCPKEHEKLYTTLERTPWYGNEQHEIIPKLITEFRNPQNCLTVLYASVNYKSNLSKHTNVSGSGCDSLEFVEEKSVTFDRKQLCGFHRYRTGVSRGMTTRTRSYPSAH